MEAWCDVCKFVELDPRELPCRDCVTIDGKPSKFRERVEEVVEESTTNPNVDHPNHYNRDGAMECLDEMVTLYGKDETAIFCKLNAHKYRYRAGLKGEAAEDFAKSDFYIRKYKELCGR